MAKHTIEATGKFERERLDESIKSVIAAKYKKDCNEELRIVESYGYEVYKSDGKFVVRNNDTNKCLSGKFQHGYHVWASASRQFGHHERVKFNKRNVSRSDNMDVIAYLNTPYNRAWMDYCDGQCANRLSYMTIAEQKFYRYLDIRSKANGYDREIELAMKQIKNLTNRIVELTKLSVEAKTMYEQEKARLGIG